ncbi:hypothetical protein [Streptomyces sp. NPDC059753]|uniref:hypothetical protein n=1 Tax=Streptomyces sp. NPDC059753 TaxID=3346933 RepID=UPI003658B467
MRPFPAVPRPLRPGPRADGDAERLTDICPGKHGRWERICVLDDGHETSMEELHWDHNGEGRSPHQLPPTHFVDNSD